MSDSALPIPADLPLALPVPAPLLVALIIVFFVAHILFVNLMLGGSLLALGFELVGLRKPRCDAIAHEIARTITVSKSLAVVLGVGPLLVINLLYTIPFYSATRVTGRVWLLIVPMTIAAFLLTYLHKYSWERLKEHKAIHLTIGALASVLFLSIPMIFLVNINLMLFPEKWTAIQGQGFLAGVFLDSVIPRYVHFILASVSATGLFLVWYLTRPAYPLAERLPGESRADLRRRLYTIALVPSLVQIIAGPMVLLTLPAQGLGGLMIAHILAGAAIGILAMWWMWREIGRPLETVTDTLGRPFWRIVIALTVTVLFMATGRHLYRANALASFNAQVAEKTTERQAKSAHYRANPQRPVEDDPLAQRPGYAAFKQACMACHAIDSKVVGPSVQDLSPLYQGPNGSAELVRWIRTVQNPKVQRDRAVFPPMPAIGPAQLSDADAEAAARFVIESGVAK